MANPEELNRFMTELRQAVLNNAFVRMTLNRPEDCDRIMIRPIELKGDSQLSFVYRHPTQDITRNLGRDDALKQVELLLTRKFSSAMLEASPFSWQLNSKKSGAFRLIRHPAAKAPPDQSHDRKRDYLINAGTAPWLRALDIAAPNGAIKAGKTAKFRQINKFAEIVQSLLTETYAESKPSLSIVDMGCGKGYLTFAVWQLLQQMNWPDCTVRGIENRPELVKFCNSAAQAHHCSGLQFEASRIEDSALSDANVLIALHACDTATDEALARGVQSGADLLITSPCCHKELRRQIQSPDALAAGLKHGILHERQSEWVTDALRAALLEWAGYRTKVFEFISTEHTSKNLMITAVKQRGPTNRDAAAQTVNELAGFFGIRTQTLASRLGFEFTVA